VLIVVKLSFAPTLSLLLTSPETQGFEAQAVDLNAEAQRQGVTYTRL
jgi:hypothetical protein